MLAFLGSCGTAFATYLLFAGSLSLSEVATGAVLAILLATWVRLAAGVYRRPFAFSAAHARVWARACGEVPGQTLITAGALAATILRGGENRGRADERPFRLGPANDPQERARRASAVLAASLAPASYVVDAGPDRDVALLHGIGRTPAPKDAEWLA